MCSRDGSPQVSPVDAALAEIERGIDGLRGCASSRLPEGSTRGGAARFSTIAPAT